MSPPTCPGSTLVKRPVGVVPFVPPHVIAATEIIEPRVLIAFLAREHPLVLRLHAPLFPERQVVVPLENLTACVGNHPDRAGRIRDTATRR